jgi:Family of unknown function (DUF5941)/CDP-alcohol phosphatidyltransferase
MDHTSTPPYASVERPAPRRDGTHALLFATVAAGGGGPAAALPWEGGTVLSRMIDQLASLGVDSVDVVTRPGFEAALEPVAPVITSESVAQDLGLVAAEALQPSTAPLVVAMADVLTHREALAGLLADPRLQTGILATGRGHGWPFTPVTRVRRARVVAAGSAFHSVEEPGQRFLGVLKVAAADRPVLADAARRLAEADLPPLGPGWDENVIADLEQAQSAVAVGHEPEVPEDTVVPRPSAELDAEIERRRYAAKDDTAALLLVGLVRSNVAVGNAFVRELFWARPLTHSDIETAREEITDYDEDKALLDSAVKAADGFFTTFFVSPYSRYIARWAARRGLGPNQVTAFSMLLGVLAAAGFATGERWGLVAGAVLLQAAFTFDCVDGQLARYTRTFTKFGAWLDSIFDRAKEYVVYAGLAIGASAAGEPAWLLAGAAITLQTARHTMEFSWAASMHQEIAVIDHPPLSEPRDAPPRPAPSVAARKGAPARRSLLRRIVSAWTALDKNPRALWFKRIVAFPIGERFAVISLMAALTTPRTTFVVVLVCGGLAGLYSVTGRVLRSIAR